MFDAFTARIAKFEAALLDSSSARSCPGIYISVIWSYGHSLAMLSILSMTSLMMPGPDCLCGLLIAFYGCLAVDEYVAFVARVAL
jgi:hypothetical protein